MKRKRKRKKKPLFKLGVNHVSNPKWIEHNVRRKAERAKLREERLRQRQ